MFFDVLMNSDAKSKSKMDTNSATSAKTLKCCGEKCNRSIGSSDRKLQCAVCYHTFHSKCGGLEEKDADNFAKIMEESIYVNYHCMNCVGIKFVEMVKNATDKIIYHVCRKVDDVNLRMLEIPKQLKKDVNEKIDVISDKMEPWNLVVSKKKNKSTPSVVIKPKDLNTKRDEIRKTLTEKMNSDTYGFIDARMSSKNGIIISCDNEEKQREFATEAGKILGEKFDVKCNKELMPRMKIVSVIVDNDISDEKEKIERLLKDRNVELKNALHAKVVYMFQRRKFDSTTEKCLDVIMEVDKVTYKHYVDDGNRIKLAWMSCPVYDGIYIKRCVKCLGFGHKKEVCKREVACTKCGGNHLRKECKSADVRCTNCQRVNSIAKKEIYKIDHGANSNDCPCLMQQKERMRSMINFE